MYVFKLIIFLFDLLIIDKFDFNEFLEDLTEIGQSKNLKMLKINCVPPMQSDETQ